MIAEALIENLEESADAPPPRRLRAVLPQDLRRHFRSARELDRDLREAREDAVMPTAVPALDRLLDGGLPRGQLVELVGARTSGRFSTVLAALATATAMGEAAALVDLGDSFDPAAAAGLGADLRRLLWLRPLHLKPALAAVEMVLASGFPLVVIDLGMPPLRGGRGLEAAWLRLARAARTHSAALLVATPYRVSGTAAGIVLQVERARATWTGEGRAVPLLSGTATHLSIEKHRGRMPGQGEEMRWALTPLAPLSHLPVPLPGRGGNAHLFGSERKGGLPLPQSGGEGWGEGERDQSIAAGG